MRCLFAYKELKKMEGALACFTRRLGASARGARPLPMGSEDCSPNEIRRFLRQYTVDVAHITLHGIYDLLYGCRAEARMPGGLRRAPVQMHVT